MEKRGIKLVLDSMKIHKDNCVAVFRGNFGKIDFVKVEADYFLCVQKKCYYDLKDSVDIVKNECGIENTALIEKTLKELKTQK